MLNGVARRRFSRTVTLWPAPGQPDFTPRSKGEDIEVTRHQMFLRNLPRSFEGLSIVHLTDIHHSKYVSFNSVYRMVTLVNQMAPDLIFLTGDYVTWSRKYIQPLSDALKNLRPGIAAMAVLGNHDFRVGAEGVSRALEAANIRVLRNDSATVRRGSESLWIAGVDEYSYGRSDLAGALSEIPAQGPRILLAHNPEIISQAALHRVDFVLAGHTHGGQVNLPYLNSLISLAQPNQESLQGFVTHGLTKMYISRGLGKVVVPMRVYCRPEIPVFRLRRYPEPSILGPKPTGGPVH